ncbi:Craniofacial development protein 2 [Lamellibrachia satsuma]|nr:Craniofacial development protein 2 [Lamellibrachia satsuma]
MFSFHRWLASAKSNLLEVANGNWSPRGTRQIRRRISEQHGALDVYCACGIRSGMENIIELPKAISDRLMKMRICIQADNNKTFATLFSVYGPTLPSSDTAKERFYEELCHALRAVSTTDKRIVLGDFNARVGSDHVTWDRVLERFGRSNCNANGELLLSLCADFDLAITNSYSSVPDKWFYTWQHPISKRCHLLDYVLTRRSNSPDVCIT